MCNGEGDGAGSVGTLVLHQRVRSSGNAVRVDPRTATIEKQFNVSISHAVPAWDALNLEAKARGDPMIDAR
jgi:hypothetical protein